MLFFLVLVAYCLSSGGVLGGFLMAWSDEYWKGCDVASSCKDPCPVGQNKKCSVNAKMFDPEKGT